MELTYYGANCVKLTANKNLTILIDPVTGEYGPNPKLKADVLLYSQTPKGEVKAQSDFILDTPGEYEIKGVTIDGIATRLHTESSEEVFEGVAYVVAYKGLRILICGNIHPTLSEEQVDRIDGIDALVVPVGGKGLTLDSEAASDFVRRFDPNFVLPIHHNDDISGYPTPQDEVDVFLHEVGASDAERQDSFKIAGRDAGDQTNYVVLNPQKKS